MDLLYFLKVLYRKIWIIIGLSILAILITFFLLAYKHSQYTSVAQYSTGFTSERVKLADGTSAIDLYTVDVKFDNVIETIKSPQVISRISYSLLLHDLTNPSKAFTNLPEKTRHTTLYKEVNKENVIAILTEKLAKNELLGTDVRNEHNILEYLKLYDYDYASLVDNLGVNRVARTDYLDITFNSENPYLSATIVNSIGNEFLNYYKGLNLKRTNENAQSIKDLLHNQQDKVDSLGQKLLTEKISQGSIDPLSRTKSAMETVTELESKLADEKAKYNEHQNRYAYLTGRLNTFQSAASPEESKDEVIKLINSRNDLVAALARKGGSDPVMEKQIMDLRTEINAKSTNGPSKNKRIDAIDDLNRQISEEKLLVNSSKSTIADYESRIRYYTEMTNVNPGSGVKMDEIKTQLDMENKQLGNVRELYSQVEGLAKDDPTSDFIQTRVGQPSGEPNSKKTLVKMALSGLSVFFLSAVFFLFLEIFDSSIKTPGIFSRLSKTKISNVINKVDLKSQNASVIMLQEFPGKKFVRYNVFKNNIRKLRYELLNSGKKVFLFTSTQSKTGKSTIIEALSASLLLSKKKVLIIDMNFSNNTLTSFFNTETYIQDIKFNNTIPAGKQKIADNTQYENLYILGCKTGNITPSEALYNVDLPALFQYIKDNFDFVLIEGASLNNFADSKELAQYADRIFTVFSADTSMLPVDVESMKFIKDLKEKNQGAILNKVLTENINS